MHSTAYLFHVANDARRAVPRAFQFRRRQKDSGPAPCWGLDPADRGPSTYELELQLDAGGICQAPQLPASGHQCNETRNVMAIVIYYCAA